MSNFITKFYKKPTALEIAVSDLEDAKRYYLKSISSAEYHASQAAYYDGLIARLSNYIRENAE